MSYKSIVGGLFIVLVLLFSAGCGAGVIPEDPTLPWEVTETLDAPVETATLPPNDPPTATDTATATDTPTSTTEATVIPSETLPAFTATPSQTPTHTPTHTTQPAVPTAPPDANFNSPLTIPLDSTASVTDFVSFPGGDTIDRVRFDVSGMNSNAALSGGRARLVIAVSCFGTGTQNITFFTGGASFSCGQTIVDNEITFDSRTGQVTIEAIGGENTYVQWVLTGTATRVN